MKGLKLYEDIFTDSELCKLTDFVNDIHAAGQKGELSGKTYLNSLSLLFIFSRRMAFVGSVYSSDFSLGIWILDLQKKTII